MRKQSEDPAVRYVAIRFFFFLNLTRLRALLFRMFCGRSGRVLFDNGCRAGRVEG